ncbi:Intracellular ribonuclease LX [Camellia lanceoleosa]|uniref:Intracellular ribonuclease LX n=1 Tax=Camellia lanceoleosa TaxID=1840588 RepID=A0ACC0J3K4_9ERIC|nr:Intracellular ribonuclease LX [Camellia lanceoleosa]
MAWLAGNENKRSKRSSCLLSSWPISAFERFAPSLVLALVVGLGAAISSAADLIEEEAIDAFGRLFGYKHRSCLGVDPRSADFFYLVLQWPGSYCGGKQGCCYPKTGKPAKDFTIAGLWPCNLDATIPEFCNFHGHFNLAKTKETGIQPNGATYDAAMGVEEGIRKAVGYMPGLWCNEDKSGKPQLYQVVLCSNVGATKIIDCPGIPMKAKCAPYIKFPSF